MSKILALTGLNVDSLAGVTSGTRALCGVALGAVKE